jgi:hypothetical protein
MQNINPGNFDQNSLIIVYRRYGSRQVSEEVPDNKFLSIDLGYL